MVKKFLIAFIASLAFGAQAAPIVFTNVTYDTTAFAFVGALADAHSAASPPSSLPLLSDATVVGANDFATSSAFASSGLMFTSAEADSFVGLPAAVGASSGAQSHFLGSVLSTGLLQFYLGFDTLDSLVGNGSSDGTLFVLLTNTVGATTTTVLNNVYSTAGPIRFDYFARSGITRLDLVLFSEAATTAAGQAAQNFSQVVFSGVIPLPATPLLLVAGLGAMLVMRRKGVGTPA